MLIVCGEGEMREQRAVRVPFMHALGPWGLRVHLSSKVNQPAKSSVPRIHFDGTPNAEVSRAETRERIVTCVWEYQQPSEGFTEMSEARTRVSGDKAAPRTCTRTQEHRIQYIYQ